MPKQRITKEMVIDAAFELAREGGIEQVLVKNIAEKLGCSVQPIYSYCSNMDGLKRDLQERTGMFFREYVAAHVNPKQFFYSTGMAYLHLAKEEPHLYALYFMQKRFNSDVSTVEELYAKECNPMIAERLSQELGISVAAAKKLHFHMVVYNAGVASMMIASNFRIEIEQMQAQLEMAYQAFLAQARCEEENE